MTDTCPHCSADLREQTGYRTIGHEIRGVYDGVLYWECPDCFGTWHRWPEGSSLRRAAASHIHGSVAA